MTDDTYENESHHTPESRDRDARMVGYEVKADTSEEAIVEILDALDRITGEEIDVEARAARNMIAALEAENQRLREAEAWQLRSRAQHFLRRNLNAPEDPHVEALCERYGYGAVIDAASRLWARKDGSGAFYVGGCIGMRSDEEARAALKGDKT